MNSSLKVGPGADGFRLGLLGAGLPPEIRAYKSRVAADGGGVIDLQEPTRIVKRLKSLNLLQKVSLLKVPSAKKAAKLYSILPASGNGDFTFNRGSVKWVLKKSGFLERIAANEPAMEYDPVTGVYNILMEPQRTNYLINSVWTGGLNPTSWTNVLNDGTRGIVASIFGNSDASVALSFAVSSQRNFIQQQFTTVANAAYSVSVFIESSSYLSVGTILNVAGGLGGDLLNYYANGVPVTSSFVPSAMCRLTLVYSNTSGGAQTFRFGAGVSNNSTGTVILSRPQLEVGKFPTSFIPTTTGTATRLLDYATRTDALLFPASGTFIIDFTYNGIASEVDRFLFSIRLDATNLLYFWIQAGTSNLNVQMFAGSAQFNQSKAITAGRHKLLFTYETNNSAMYFDGAVVGVVDTACNIPAANILQLGYSTSSPAPINSLAIVSQRLSAQECITLSTL